MKSKHKFSYYLPLIWLILYCFSDGDLTHAKKLYTDAELVNIIQSCTLSDGAKFYKKQRTINPHLDDIYAEMVLPEIQTLNYYQIKELIGLYERTPMEEFVKIDLEIARNEMLETIEEELYENGEYYKELFRTEVLPKIIVELDLKMEEDFEEAMDKYSGGFLGIRKIALVFGRDEEKFLEIWDEVCESSSYDYIMDKYSLPFINTLEANYSDYIDDIVNKPCLYTTEDPILPYIGTSIPDSVKLRIKDYTSDAATKTIISGIRDFLIPALLTSAVGVGAAAIYDFGTDVYDICSIMDDLSNARLSPEDVLTYESVYIMSEIHISSCIDKIETRMDEKIDEMNEEALQIIKKEL